MGNPEVEVVQISVEEAQERAKRDPVNSVVAFNTEAAVEAEKARRRGVEPFPFGVKDIVHTRGIKTTMGSKLYANFVPKFDATVVSELKQAGGVMVFKTNTHELASGATTTSSIFGPTKNPHDPLRISGGSSGGSAAAVGANLVEVAVGTDTAGSVRIPASLCGVYGFKPTSRRISLRGVLPLAPSLDSMGFLASNTKWLSMLANIFSLRDSGQGWGVRSLRVGVPSWVYWLDKTPEEYASLVERCTLEFERRLDRLGLEWVKVDMEVAERLVWRFFPIVRLAEAARTHLDKKDFWGECFPDVRRLLEKGLGVSAVDYLNALASRREVYREFRRALKRVDVLATPTTSITAPRISEVLGKEDGNVRAALTHNTVYASYLGLPAISIPGLSVDGLPLGVQLVGDRDTDKTLIKFAEALSEK
ncbi:MAG: amidase [Thermoprotei archaeon]